MAYPNGKIPLDKLVHLGGDHYLMPGTAIRWAGFVADVKAETGVTMRITPGPNGYRWYEAQVDAKKDACARGRCGDAADPGDSSHGGQWRGTETCAIDVTNWADIPWKTFERLAEKWGFIVLFFPWEKWHIIDPNPWVTPSATGAGGAEDVGMTSEEWRQFQVLAGNVNEIKTAVANINAWISEGGPGVEKGAAKPGTVAARVINVDRQVTGADGQQINLVQHVLDVKKIAAQGGVTEAQADHIAEAVAKAVGLDPAALAKAVNDDAAARLVD
jgi:hypothetical protein